MDDPFTKVFIDNGNEILHPFYECSLDLFKDTDKDRIENIFVALDHKANKLILSRNQHPNSHSKSLPFQHAPQCPMRHLPKETANELKSSSKLQFVRIGVSLIIENEKNEVLITRRAKHMRTFPQAWVLPGGHMEINETFEDAGIRELYEETGIQLKSPPQLFFLYESVYPVMINLGNPTRHHIVIFLYAKVNSNNIVLKLQKEEVDAASWINKSVVNAVLSNQCSNMKFNSMFVCEDGTLKDMEFEVEQLRQRFEDEKLLPEGISTGVRYVLQEWLKL